MTRIFMIAAIGFVAAIAGIFAYQAAQPPLKERFLAQLRSDGGDFIGIARAECVFDEIVERHGLETMKVIFDNWKTIREEIQKKQDEFDEKWKNIKERRDILLKAITAQVACEKPKLFEPAVFRAARHTPPLILSDWGTEVKRTGNDDILIVKCQLQNQMHVSVAVLDGRIRFLSAAGAEVHTMTIERGMVLVAGETVTVQESYVVGAEGATFGRDRVRAVLDVKLIQTEEGRAFTY